MANKKISDFTELTAPASSDIFAVLDASESTASDKNKKISYANILGKAPDGSASSPSFSFNSDTNSGISGGSDTLVLSTGGTAALSVDSSQNVTLSANLTVSGTTTTINTTNLDVEDKNITLGKVSTPSDTTADGGGLTLKGASDKTFNWVNSTDSWTSSEHISVSGQKEFRYLDSDSSHYVGFKAPATVSSNLVWTLPAVDASVSGYVLSSNASGVLSWVDPGSTASPSFTGNVSLTNDGNIVGPASIHALYTGSVKTFTVTVASKDATHRYNGTGSSNGYKIDGKFAPFITLTPGRTYKFDQADASNSGHPLLFYEEADKTTAYTTNVTTSGTPGSGGAYTQIVITDSTPIVLHYQCSSHAHMGNAIQTNSSAGSDGNATTVTVADESSDTTCFPLFVTAATGSLAPKSGSNLAFNSSTGALTATSFVGALTGNVTGNTSGSSGSCTGNSATATTSTNVTVADESSDTTCFPLFVTGATGDLPPKSGSNLAFNSSTGALTATSFVGDGSNLTGIAGGGKLLQVGYVRNTTSYATTSEFPQDCFSFNFTPTSASSTIYIIASLNLFCNVMSGGNVNLYAQAAITKNDNTILGKQWIHQQHDHPDRNDGTHAPTCAQTLVIIGSDSPSSTSQQTYKIRFGRGSVTHRVATADESGANDFIQIFEVGS